MLAYKEYLLNSMETALYRATYETCPVMYKVHMAAYMTLRSALDEFKSAMAGV